MGIALMIAPRLAWSSRPAWRDNLRGTRPCAGRTHNRRLAPHISPRRGGRASGSCAWTPAMFHGKKRLFRKLCGFPFLGAKPNSPRIWVSFR